MIEPISASLDVYPHLRLDVSQQARGRAQQQARQRAEELQEEQRQRTAATLYLETDERQQAERPDARDDGKVVLFQQSATLENQQPGENAEAEEVLPALEASVLPRDLRLAYAVQIYNRASRIGIERETIGTRLNAVA